MNCLSWSRVVVIWSLGSASAGREQRGFLEETRPRLSSVEPRLTFVVWLKVRVGKREANRSNAHGLDHRPQAEPECAPAAAGVALPACQRLSDNILRAF